MAKGRDLTKSAAEPFKKNRIGMKHEMMMRVAEKTEANRSRGLREAATSRGMLLSSFST